MDSSLLFQLCERYYDFELYQWMYLMERYAISIGLDEFGGVEYARQIINFKSSLLLSVPATDIDDISMKNETIHAKVNIGCLGNLNGPLDSYYIEKLINNYKNGDLALIELLDIFNHQLICVLYKVAKSIWPSMNIDSYQSFVQAMSDNIAHEQPDIFAALDIWSGNFNLPVIENYVKIKLGVEVKATNKIGVKLPAKKLQAILGASYMGEKILGKSIKQSNYGVNLRIIAKDIVQYNQLLPNQKLMRQIVDNLKHNLSFVQPVTVHLSLNSDKKVNKNLGISTLGYNSLLGNKAAVHNVHTY